MTVLADLGELLHQLLVDLEAAGGIDDDDVLARLGGLRDSVARDRDRVLRAGVDGNLDLPAELLELLDRGRPLEVGRDQRGLLALLAQEERELGGSGRLARALKAREQDDGRRPAGERELRAAASHQRGQLLVDDLHDLLPRRQALQDVLPERALAHALDELLHHLEVDVRLEQRQPDLAHRARDRLLVERPALADVAERRLELV